MERIIRFDRYIFFSVELQKSSGLRFTGRTLWPGPGIFVYSCPAEFNEQRFIKMFVTEDGNTRGRATLRDGHIAVGDVVRYGPCFFLMGQYEDGYNGCRYWRFGSRVKILMLTSEHTAFKFMINKHVEERNHVLVLNFFVSQASQRF